MTEETINEPLQRLLADCKRDGIDGEGMHRDVKLALNNLEEKHNKAYSLMIEGIAALISGNRSIHPLQRQMITGIECISTAAELLTAACCEAGGFDLAASIADAQAILEITGRYLNKETSN